jgi:hypothetical protein
MGGGDMLSIRSHLSMSCGSRRSLAWWSQPSPPPKLAETAQNGGVMLGQAKGDSTSSWLVQLSFSQSSKSLPTASSLLPADSIICGVGMWGCPLL